MYVYNIEKIMNYTTLLIGKHFFINRSFTNLLASDAGFPASYMYEENCNCLEKLPPGNHVALLLDTIGNNCSSDYSFDFSSYGNLQKVVTTAEKFSAIKTQPSKLYT